MSLLTYSPAFIARLEHHSKLSEVERETLAGIDVQEASFLRGETVMPNDRHPFAMAVLKEGSAALHQPIGFGTATLWSYFAGDLIGGTSELDQRNVHHVVAQSSCQLCYVDRDTHRALLRVAPGLDLRFRRLQHRSRLMQDAHFASALHHNAEHRMKHFLLRAQERINDISAVASDRFFLSATQQDLGDMLRLTSIYVSRLLSRFKRNGELQIDRRNYRLMVRDQWIEETGFTPVV